jgi:heterotetrameric sarcosine oxidase gamma subunit
VFERTSALTGALAGRGRNGTDSALAVRIGEVRGFRLFQVAAFPGMLADFEQVITPVLGGRLPVTVGEVHTIGARLLLKTGLEQFWIVIDEGDDLAGPLESTVTPAIGAVTQLSHSRTRLFVEGTAARQVLAAAIAVDLHPDTFRVGSFALTGLHHTPVLLHRGGADRYELYVLRTFALWIWELLTDAARTYGY